VILNLDEFVERYKGKRPVIGYQDRAAVLRALRDVDVVVPNVGGPDLKPSLTEVRPDLLVIGSDWKDKDYYGQIGASPDWLRKRGIALRFEPYTEHISSSLIRERLHDRP
jgi:glycerol-3-phosphate cytidylyltransferase